MAQQLGIIDILRIYGFDSERRGKLVRHQDARYDVQQLIRDGWFDYYQGFQARPIFSKCEQIVAFTGYGGTLARFLGVYSVAGHQKGSAVKLPPGFPYPEWRTKTSHFYDLHRLPDYEDIEGRLIIDWGAGALAWHQHLRNKPLVEILPKGRLLDPFTDYLDFALSHWQLINLFDQQSAHRDWKASLSAVAGVYLILDTITGQQYIGSAYGQGGIWGRWSAYAQNGHGGNQKLRQLVHSAHGYPEAFRYSVLQVLPKTTTAPEVIRWESQYKEKLGSRATGLNLN